MSKKATDEEFLKIIENAPLVSIDLIVRSAAGKILLGFRNNTPAKDSWFVPGGCIRKGESFKEAFERIVHKELGRDDLWECAEFLGIPSRHYYPNEEKLGKTVDIHYVVLPYVVRVAKEFTPPPEKQHREYQWFRPDELHENDSVHSNTKDFFEQPLNIPNDSGIYRSLVSLYIHYDRQFWSRTQILLAVQGAVLVGGYNLRSSPLGPIIMGLGFMITLIIWGLIDRDINNSRINQPIMDRLVKQIFDYHGSDWPIRLRSDPRAKCLAGRLLIRYVVIGLIIFNLGLGWLYLKHPELFPPSTVRSIEKLEGDMKRMSTKLKGLEVDLDGKSKSFQKITEHQKELERAIKKRSPK